MPERVIRYIVWGLNGKRGAVLVLHGLIFFLIGWSYLTAPDIVARTRTFGFIPEWIDPPLLGIPWIASGVVSIFFAIDWSWTSDRWGFMAATMMPLFWSLLFLTGWINGYNPLAWISAVLYLGYALIIMVVAGWPNPTRPVDVKLPKLPDLPKSSGGDDANR